MSKDKKSLSYDSSHGDLLYTKQDLLTLKEKILKGMHKRKNNLDDGEDNVVQAYHIETIFNEFISSE